MKAETAIFTERQLQNAKDGFYNSERRFLVLHGLIRELASDALQYCFQAGNIHVDLRLVRSFIENVATCHRCKSCKMAAESMLRYLDLAGNPNTKKEQQ